MKKEEQKPNNPPAHPTQRESGSGYVYVEEGMTLRDYFAAKAMQSMIGLLSPSDMNDDNYVWMSEISYKQADAMLKQREL